jgi:hypothetical protein
MRGSWTDPICVEKTMLERVPVSESEGLDLSRKAVAFAILSL